MTVRSGSHPIPTALFAAMLLAVLSGCSGGNGANIALGTGSASSPASGSTGTLAVSMTDSPACGFASVNVTVDSVRIHRSATAADTDPGWTDLILAAPRKVDLLTLTNGALTTLGQVQLAAGHYSQLRLVLDSGSSTANSVVLPGAVAELPLVVPSGTQSGIKLINEFDVPVGQRVDLVLDFDACRSVVPRGLGAFALVPVVRVVPAALNGIQGFVSPALLGSNVLVSAQSNGTVIASTAPDPQTAQFTVSHVAAGSYDLVVSSDDHATVVITGVPVPQSGLVMVSTNAAPISPPAAASRVASGSAILSPPNNSVSVHVAAKQLLGAGPLVTVKTLGADLSSGTFSLNLPVAAPLVGSYGSGTLPVALTAQTSAAGLYSLEASAIGYTTQSASIDISSASALRSFTLTP